MNNRSPRHIRAWVLSQFEFPVVRGPARHGEVRAFARLETRAGHLTMKGKFKLRHHLPFLRFDYAGRTYLAVPPWLLGPGRLPWWIKDSFDHAEKRRVEQRARFSPSRHPASELGWFAIEENAGVEFLNALSSAIHDRKAGLPATMRLPTVEPSGFALTTGERKATADADEPYQYSLFRDGLALLGEPFRGRLRDVVVWAPSGGIVPP